MTFILIICIVLLVLSFFSPFFGLINYMAILYLRPNQTWPMLAPYHLPKVFAIAIALAFILKCSKEKKIFFNFKQDKILIFFLGVILCSCVVGWIPRCLEVFEQMAKNVIVYGLIVGLVNSEKKLKILIWVLLIITGILAFNTVQEFSTVNTMNLDKGRLGAFSGAYFGDSNDFAVMINIMVPFAFLFGVFGRTIKSRFFSLLILVYFVVAVIASRSRGGFINFGLLMMFLGSIGMKSRKTWQRFISIIFVVVIIGGVVAFAPSVFKERASTILDYQNQDTATERIENWKLGIKMFISNPIIGVGAGNYQMRYRDFGGWRNQWMVAHSMYIDVISELGILGIWCFFLLLHVTFKEGKNVGRMLKDNKMDQSFLYIANQGARLSLLAYCIGGLFLSILTYPMLYIVIAINVAAQNLAVLKLKKVEA